MHPRQLLPHTIHCILIRDRSTKYNLLNSHQCQVSTHPSRLPLSQVWKGRLVWVWCSLNSTNLRPGLVVWSGPVIHQLLLAAVSLFKSPARDTLSHTFADEGEASERVRENQFMKTHEWMNMSCLRERHSK